VATCRVATLGRLDQLAGLTYANLTRRERNSDLELGAKMIWEVSLAVAAALVAILATIYDPKEGSISQELIRRTFDPKKWERKSVPTLALIIAALVIMGLAIMKSVKDDDDKEFMRTAITETIPTAPDTIKAIFNKMKAVAGPKYTVFDYSNVDNGMVIFLRPSEGSGSIENIILSASDLAKIGGSLILKEDPSPLLRRAMAQAFNFGEYSEDLYLRLCALFSVSSRQVLFKKPVDCDYDGEQGITVTINVNNVERQVNLSVDEIKEYKGREAKAAFGAMNEVLRRKVKAIAD
jgi:hypothetical protein